jgi:hypothetical protein
MMAVVDLNNPYFSDIREMKRKADVEGLIQVLRHEKADLKREAAAEVLGEIGDEKAVDDLVKHSLNDVEGVREKAFWTLAKIADDAIFASMKVAEQPVYLCRANLPERIEWPANCCICLRSPQILKETLCKGLEPIMERAPYARYRYRYSLFTRITRVPYCLDCLRKTEKRFFGEKEGVEIELIVKNSEVVSTKIKFRNPVYAKKFLEVNS